MSARKHTNDAIDRLVVQSTGEFPTCHVCGKPKAPGSDCEEANHAE